jgi:hypothetical protein
MIPYKNKCDGCKCLFYSNTSMCVFFMRHNFQQKSF